MESSDNLALTHKMFIFHRQYYSVVELSLYGMWGEGGQYIRVCPCENEVGFIGTVLELSGTHFNGTFWDNHLIPINPNIGIIWY